MRALTALLTALFTFPAASAESPVLHVEVQGHYGKETTRVFLRQKEWSCETELVKSFPLEAAPEALRLFPERKPASVTGCRDKVKARINYRGKKTEWEGCAEHPESKQFLQALAKDCGR